MSLKLAAKFATGCAAVTVSCGVLAAVVGMGPCGGPGILFLIAALPFAAATCIFLLIALWALAAGKIRLRRAARELSLS